MRTIAIALFTLAGCIDEFHGSNIQFEFAETVPPQASAFGPAATDELPHNIHFTLYAFDSKSDPMSGTSTGYMFEVQTFEIHHVVDLASPCFIDVGDHVPIEGLHVSQYAAEVAKLKGIPDYMNPPDGASEQDKIDVATAVQRQRNVTAMAGLVPGVVGPKVISAASTASYGAVAADCSDTNGIPPPTCVDADSNRRRLQMCQAEWAKNPAYFEGTDRVLTAPLNGTTYGFVQGTNPVNSSPIGGAQFFVDEALDDFAGFAIYWQYDDANNDGMPDYPSSVPSAERTELGELFLYGHPETNIARGVIRVPLRNIQQPNISAELVIFAGIDDDDVHF